MNQIINKKVGGITVFTLVMLITGSIDNIRNLPTTALFGTTLVFFFIFSAIVFLIPAGLVSAELASTWTEKGGIYHWTKLAFGKHWGFVAIWLQWINTMVWYPTILSFIAGTLTYLLDPSLANSKLYLVSVILISFWGLTIVNLKGLHLSAKFASICAIFGMVIPMLLIISLFLIWMILGKPLQIHFTSHNIFPTFHTTDSWISLTAIMTAFLGMELAAVHVNEIKNPQKTFPKALFISVIFILVTMVLGSLAIAYIVPAATINLVDGIMQAFQDYLQTFHMGWALPILTILLLVGSLGGIINWIISPAKGLLHATEDGYLPKFLQKTNKYNVAQNLLILQAIVVSVVCLAFILMPSVNGSYWLLTDLSTQLYMLMYVLMFLGAIVLKFKYSHVKREFAIPGGKLGMIFVGLLGLVGTFITLIVGFFPPEGINVGGAWHYEISFSIGLILMIVPIVLFFWYQKVGNKAKVIENEFA